MNSIEMGWFLLAGIPLEALRRLVAGDTRDTVACVVALAMYAAMYVGVLAILIDLARGRVRKIKHFLSPEGHAERDARRSEREYEAERDGLKRDIMSLEKSIVAIMSRGHNSRGAEDQLDVLRQRLAEKKRALSYYK